MGLVIPSSQQIKTLEWLLNQLDSNPWNSAYMHLFTNDYTPTVSSTTGDFTECVASGYAAQPADVGNFGTPTIVSGKASAAWTGTPTTFTSSSSGGQLCYGYYLLNNDDSSLLWAERFDAPRTLQSSSPILVTMNVTLQSLNT